MENKEGTLNQNVNVETVYPDPKEELSCSIFKIKRKELSIGNYVWYNGKICVVWGITSPVPSDNEKFNQNNVVTLFDGGVIFRVTLDECKPIKLTNEVLESFKHKRTYGKIVIKCRRRIIRFDGIEVLSLCGTKKGWWWKCNNYRVRHLHQLQNLYYLLTGEVLKENKQLIGDVTENNI